MRPATQSGSLETPCDEGQDEFDASEAKNVACVSTMEQEKPMIQGGRRRYSGAVQLAQTLEVDLFSGIVEGDGPCREDSESGTCFVWDGPQNEPAIRITRCHDATMRDLRIKSGFNLGGGSAIEIASRPGDSPVNPGLRLSGLWIGSFPGDNSGPSFANGIRVSGTQQCDQSSMRDITIQDVQQAGVSFENPQAVLWDISSLRVNNARYGIQTSTRHMTVRSFYPSTIGVADIHMPGDAQIHIVGSGSELSNSLAKAVNGYSITIEQGYFQLHNDITSTGNIVDCRSDSDGRLRLCDFDFRVRQPYSGVNPKLKLRAKTLSVEMSSVAIPSNPDQFFDFAIEGPFDRRHVLFKNVTVPGVGCWSGEFWWRAGQAAPVFSRDCQQ